MAPVKSGIDAALCAVARSAPPTGAGACARAGDAAAAATDEINAKMKFRRFKAMCLSLTCPPLVGFRLHWIHMCREASDAGRKRRDPHPTRHLGECQVGSKPAH